MRRAAAALLCATGLVAADAQPSAEEAPDPDQAQIVRMETPEEDDQPAQRPAPEDCPGGAPATAPAQPQALIIRWDQYRTVVVVGEGVGLRRPAWVATYFADQAALASQGGLVLIARRSGFDPKRWSEQPLVAYRALAYMDSKDRLHIDARRVVVSGPLGGRTGRDAWVPDSFLVTWPDRVDAVDDEPLHPPNRGRLETVITPLGQPDRYRELHEAAQRAVLPGI